MNQRMSNFFSPSRGGTPMLLMVRRIALLALLWAVPFLTVAVLPRGQTEPQEQGWLYIANLRSADVSVVDLSTGQETARLPVADNPHELAAAGRAVWVSNYRSASVTCIARALICPSSNPGEGMSPLLTMGVFSPFADVEAPGSLLPTALSLLSGGEGRAAGALSTPEPHGLAAAADHMAITLGRAGRVALLDTVTGGVRAEIETGGEPHMVAAVHGRLYVVDAAGDALIEIDAQRAAVTRRVTVGRTPESLAIHPDGRIIAIANARSGDLSLVDIESFRERARLPVPGAPVRVAYSPDGRTLAVSLQDKGQVLLLDAGSGQTRARVAVGERPDGLAFSPSGRLLYVALTGERRVAALRLRDRRITAFFESGDGPSGLLVVR